MTAAHETWKYRTLKVDGFPNLVPLESLERQMNVLGLEGYELAEVIRGTNYNILLFKQIAYPEVTIEQTNVSIPPISVTGGDYSIPDEPIWSATQEE